MYSSARFANARREGQYVNHPGTSTIPLRTSSQTYPPPPPPPNRLRTFSPDGRVGRSPDQSPSSVVYPSGMEPYAKPAKLIAKQQQQNTLPLRHGSHGHPVNLSSDPWQQQGPVIGESVIV